MTKIADIFISYAKLDRQYAERLADALARLGWAIWWDPQIEPGDDFDEVIEAALDAADCVIVLWSEISVKSRYVRGEAREAIDQNKLVPAFIEDVKPPMDFRAIQGVFLTDWDGDDNHSGYQQLLTRITSLIGNAVVEAEPPTERGQTNDFDANGDVDSLESEMEAVESLVLDYFRGKPDVHWTLDLVVQMLKALKRARGIEVERLRLAVKNLVTQGYLSEQGGALSVTDLAISRFRREGTPVIDLSGLGEPLTGPSDVEPSDIQTASTVHCVTTSEKIGIFDLKLEKTLLEGGLLEAIVVFEKKTSEAIAKIELEHESSDPISPGRTTSVVTPLADGPNKLLLEELILQLIRDFETKTSKYILKLKLEHDSSNPASLGWTTRVLTDVDMYSRTRAHHRGGQD